MEEKNKKKKKLVIGIICLVLVGLVVLLFGTYAYWQVTKKQTNKNLVGSACLDITFSNETGDINIENMWPTSDADGSALVPYTFTITNNCDILMDYTIALEEIKEDGLTYPTDYLLDSSVKIKFDSLAPVKISTLDTITSDNEEDYEIYATKHIVTRHLAGGASRTHSVRIWLDANAPKTEMNKFFSSKIKITGGQGIEAECYTVNSEGILYAYDADCGTSATIPATVDGKEVKTIASTAFKGSRTITVPNISVYDFYLYYEKAGDQAKPNAKINSINDFHDLNGTCDSRTSAQCQVDYSIAFSKDFGALIEKINAGEMEQFMQEHNLASEEDLIAYINDNYDENDLFVIIYYTGSDTDKLNAIRTQAAQSDYFNVAKALGWNINYYNKGSEPSSAGGLYEYYYALSYYTSEGYSGRDLGWSEPAEGTTTVTIDDGLFINSLDLSQATNLEKIESRAFSTAPDLNGITEWPDFRNYPGLTSLTFGNNTNNIELGGAAFSGANLNDLTIYTNYVTPSFTNEEATLFNQSLENSTDKTPVYQIMNPFVGSTIHNLTITGAGGVTEYNGMPGFSVTTDPYNSMDVLGYLIVVGEFGAIFADNITFTGNITTINNVPNLNSNYSLTLPDSLQTVGDYAFATFTGSSLTLPSSLTTIGYDAFQAYKGSTLTIPSSVTRIKQGAFGQFEGTATVNNSQGNVNFDSDWIDSKATVNWN